MAHIVEIVRKTVRSDPVGSAVDLELKDSQLDPNLKEHPSVTRADLSGGHLAGLWVVGPAL
jgi:hypothetical protein